MMSLGTAAVIYVGVLGLLLTLTIRPSSERLRSSSQSVLEEYRESARRAQTMDHTATDLWRVLASMQQRPVPLDTLEGLRRRVERLAETSTATVRLSSTGSASALRTILASATVFEEQLRVELLGAIASMQLGNRVAAEAMLRRADSLRTPLTESLNDATAMTLREVATHEQNFSGALTTLNAVIILWIVGGALALTMLALFLKRRLDAPLAALDRALDRVSAGDFDVQLEPGRPDEIGRLVEQFNRMTMMLRQRALEDAQRADDRSTARTRLILDAALDAVIVADADGRIREWSPQAEQTFGWTRAEALDQRVADLVIPTEFRDAHTIGMERFQRSGHGPFMNRRLELVALRRDGTRSRRCSGVNARNSAPSSATLPNVAARRLRYRKAKPDIVPPSSRPAWAWLKSTCRGATCGPIRRSLNSWVVPRTTFSARRWRTSHIPRTSSPTKSPSSA
jgi:PAS domain S-box-containing protein